MSEITKLYENVGIKLTYTDECQIADSYYSMEKDLNERGILFDDYMKQNCPNKNEVCYETCPYAYNKEFYPPFTAEKQINLTQKLWELKPNVYPNFDLLTNYSYSEMIAELANHLWQSLTEEEKQQVKGILE